MLNVLWGQKENCTKLMSFTFEPALGVLFECAVTGNVLGLNNLISTFCLQSAVSKQITVLSGGAESPSSSSSSSFSSCFRDSNLSWQGWLDPASQGRIILFSLSAGPSRPVSQLVSQSVSLLQLSSLWLRDLTCPRHQPGNISDPTFYQRAESWEEQ